MAGGFSSAPGISLSDSPVAAMMLGQWRDGMLRLWRHLRTASVPTPKRRATASAPPMVSMMLSTVTVLMRAVYGKRLPTSMFFGGLGKNFPGKAERQ